MATSTKKRTSSSSISSDTNKTASTRIPSRSAAAVEFNPDYGYVKKDLVRIGILAGSFIVILVVLSFFLR